MKMTDNEIISIDEAIRHCYETYFERDDLCRKCRKEHEQLAKWLEELKESRNTINRQVAEIEELRTENERLKNQNTSLLKKKCKDINTARKIIKAEAIKDFAKRLKEKFGIADCIVTVDNNDLDGFVKEMTEERDES